MDRKYPYSNYFYRFRYSNLMGNDTSCVEAFYTIVEYDKKHYQERQWLTISDSTGLLVVFEQNTSKGIVTRLMISNIMKSTTYRAELDTIRYIYRPKFH